MSIENKIKELLERAAPGPKYQEKGIMQGSSVIAEPSGETEDLGPAELSGVASSAKAAHAAAPGGNQDHGEEDRPMQGSSKEPQAGTEDEEDLSYDGEGGRAPGVCASKEAGVATPPGGRKGGEMERPMQGNSAMPTPGQQGASAPGPMPEETAAEVSKILAEAGVPAEAVGKLVEAFEAAVTARVAAEVEKASDTLAEAVNDLSEANAEELAESVNAYLNYAVEQWLEKNELAVESGLRTEIAESFIEGLKGLFNEHSIEIPEEKYDALAEATKRVEELEAKLNESLATTVKLTESNRALERRQIVERATRSLTVVDAEKLEKLVEDVEYSDSESFEDAVSGLKARYFSTTPGKNVPSTELNEDAAPIVDAPTGVVGAAARIISRSKK